jgi:hypothetical protein
VRLLHHAHDWMCMFFNCSCTVARHSYYHLIQFAANSALAPHVVKAHFVGGKPVRPKQDIYGGLVCGGQDTCINREKTVMAASVSIACV